MESEGDQTRPTNYIRRIELFISLIAFTLLAVSVAQRGSQIERAKDELGEIAHVLDDWDGRWIDAQVGTLVEGRFRTPSRSWRVIGGGKPLGRFTLRRNWCLRPSRDIGFERSWPHWMTESIPGGAIASPFGPQPVSQLAPPLHFTGSDYPRPETLPDFQLFWDHLSSVDFWWVKDFSPQTLFVYESPGSGIPRQILDEFEPVGAGLPSDSLDLRFRDAVGLLRPPPGVANWTERDSTWHFFHALVEIPSQSGAPPAVARLALAATAVQDSVALRPTFIAETGIRAADRTFREAFPNLVAVTALYPALSVDTLGVLLKEELLRTNVDVGLLGTSVPRSTVAVLGPVLLCMAQLYLLAHLRLVRSRSGPDARWLGTTGSFLAWIVSLLATVVLPCVAAGFAIAGFPPRVVSETIVVIVALLGMATVSAAIAATMWKVHRGLRPTELARDEGALQAGQDVV